MFNSNGNRAVGLKGPAVGDPLELFELVQREKPRASPGHVVIRVTMRPVHYSDFLPLRYGLWAKLPHQNLTVGIEGFGIIEEVGEGVTKFKPGQRVVPLLNMGPEYSASMGAEYNAKGTGLWRDFAEIHESNVLAIPDFIIDETAAQLTVSPMTVYGMVSDLQVPKGEYLLQTAAGSVLGRQVIQLAKHWGIKTINIVRRDEQKQELKDLGADEVISTASEDVVTRVKEITGGKGAYGAIDAVAGELTKSVTASVRDGGTVFIYGALGAMDYTSNLSDLMRKVQSVTASVRDGGTVFIYGALGAMDYTSNLSDLMRKVQVSFWLLPDFVNSLEKMAHVADEILKLFELKVIVPHAGKKFPLEKFREAIIESELQARGGKVLIVS